MVFEPGSGSVFGLSAACSVSGVALAMLDPPLAFAVFT
jgi:hypothetical protein